MAKKMGKKKTVPARSALDLRNDLEFVDMTIGALSRLEFERDTLVRKLQDLNTSIESIKESRRAALLRVEKDRRRAKRSK